MFEYTYKCDTCGSERVVRKSIAELHVKEWCNHNRAGFCMLNAVAMRQLPAYSPETERVMRRFIVGAEG
jgi:hypothetical protein